MLKIFSIEEIVEATNSIYKSKKPDNYVQKVNKIKLVKDQNLSENFQSDSLKYQEPLILQNEMKEIEKKGIKEEIIDDNKESNFTTQTTDHLNKSRNLLSIKEKSKKKEKDFIVDEIYKIIKKKVRKNTIKLILEQQTEITDLKDKISELRKIEYRNLRINKKLKNEISTLINNEKLLSLKFNELNEKFKVVTENENEYIKKNKELEEDLKDLENSLKITKKENIGLEQNYKSIQSQLDTFIVNEKNLIDANKNVEQNILILTNTKNSLAYETKKLKADFKIIQENKEMLLISNQKLQKEVSLLTKNKNIIIEMNDKYQEQISQLEAEKINSKENEILKDERVKILIDDKQKLIESNNKFKEENSRLVNIESDLLKNKRNLEFELNTLKNKEIVIENKNEEKILQEMNNNLQYEMKSMRANESKLIENNKKLHAELIKLRSTQNVKVHTEELKNLREKLIFHQEDNLRLSYELSSAKKRYDIMKDQLGNIEMEKSNITKKIEDLTQTIGSTNIVESPFGVEKDTNKKFFHKENVPTKDYEKKEIDINSEIKKIFIKKKKQIIE